MRPSFERVGEKCLFHLYFNLNDWSDANKSSFPFQSTIAYVEQQKDKSLEDVEVMRQKCSLRENENSTLMQRLSGFECEFSTMEMRLENAEKEVKKIKGNL